MIKRYEVKEIVDIWSQENKLSTWKKVESSVTKSLEEEGIVPVSYTHLRAHET